MIRFGAEQVRRRLVNINPTNDSDKWIIYEKPAPWSFPYKGDI